MDIKKHFQYPPVNELAASNIGIGKWDWKHIKRGDNQSIKELHKKARTIMKMNRFDVIPVEESDGKFKKYFATVEWNKYEALNFVDIEMQKTIYYKATLSDLIRKLKEQNSHFIFLSNEFEVLGLVTIANLNSLIVYNYIYQIIADLEQNISNVLKKCLNHDDVINTIRNSDDPKTEDMLKKYNEAKDKGVENTIFDNLYFSTFAMLIEKHKNELPPAYKKLGQYQKKFASNNLYNRIRNIVMHPGNLLVSGIESINNLDEFFQDYQNIKDILRHE